MGPWEEKGSGAEPPGSRRSQSRSAPTWPLGKEAPGHLEPPTGNRGSRREGQGPGSTPRVRGLSPSPRGSGLCKDPWDLPGWAGPPGGISTSHGGRARPLTWASWSPNAPEPRAPGEGDVTEQQPHLSLPGPPENRERSVQRGGVTVRQHLKQKAKAIQSLSRSFNNTKRQDAVVQEERVNTPQSLGRRGRHRNTEPTGEGTRPGQGLSPLRSLPL